MAGRLLLNSVIQNGVKIQKCSMSASGIGASVAANTAMKIGSREIVGYGYNGEPNYMDRFDRPMPAIRFKEETPDIKVLREKEKGDWRKLSIEEKKQLYRYSFCQTLAELDAPTGEWKHAIGIALLGCTLGVWTYIYLKLFAYPPLPETFDEEHRRAQLERMIILDVNPIRGLPGQK